MCQIFIIQVSFLSSERFQNFGNETLFIADYEDVKKSAFDWLAAKLWLKECTMLWKVCTYK